MFFPFANMDQKASKSYFYFFSTLFRIKEGKYVTVSFRFGVVLQEYFYPHPGPEFQCAVEAF